jgi:hypothetical protein
MLTDRLGYLLPSFASALAERGVEIEVRPAGNEVEWLDYALPRRPPSHSFPNSLSTKGLASRLIPIDRGRVVLVVGGDIWDFCLYHALAQMRQHVFWLPSTHLESSIFMTTLAGLLARAATSMGGGNHVAIISAESDSLCEPARAAIGEAAEVRGVTLEILDWRAVIPNIPLRLLDRSSAGRPQAVLRRNGETHELATPVPRGIATEPPTHMRWMVDVEVDGWAAIRHAGLAPAVLRGSVGDGHDARVTRGGVTYLGISPLIWAGDDLESAAARPRLAPLPLLEQLRAVLAPEGWTFAVSDKGAYAHQSALLFGGVDDFAKALRDADQRCVLDAYLVPREAEGHGMFIDERGRRFLAYSDIEQMVGDAAAEVLAKLTGQNVLQRGHVLKCEHCRGTSFYTLGQDERFRCFRCYAEQQATPFSWLGTPEPAFRYGIAEVIYQFLRGNGELPLLAIFDHLVTRSLGGDRFDLPLDIAHELQFRPQEPRRPREHDIVVSWGPDLWLGEASVTDRFGTAAEETARFNRIAETASAARARGVIFVTSAPAFRTSSVARARAAFRSAVWPEVRFVDGVDTGAVDS